MCSSIICPGDTAENKRHESTCPPGAYILEDQRDGQTKINAQMHKYVLYVLINAI